MPDHNDSAESGTDNSGLGTFDLDRAFDDLTGGVESRTTPPGAARAVRSSRRRRGVAVVAVVAVLAIGGGTLVNGLRSTLTADPPVASPTATPAPPTPAVPARPTPTEFTAERFNAATAGWTSGWRSGDSPVLSDPPCGSGDTGPEPRSVDSAELGSGKTLGAARTYARFGTQYDAALAFRVIEGPLKLCAEGNGSSTEFRWQGAVGVAHSIKIPGERTISTVWLVQSGDRMAILTTVGMDTEPSAEVGQRVADVLLAGLTA